MVDSYCKGCDHLSLSGAYSCDYLVNVGRRRPCRAGEGCTEHTNPPKDTKPAKKHRAEWDSVLAFEMFREGKEDRDIAEAVGVSAYTIEKWRRKKGLYRRARQWRK